MSIFDTSDNKVCSLSRSGCKICFTRIGEQASMKRIVVNVSDELYATLQNLAECEVRSVPNMLLWLAQQSLIQQKQRPKAS